MQISLPSIALYGFIAGLISFVFMVAFEWGFVFCTGAVFGLVLFTYLMKKQIVDPTFKRWLWVVVSGVAHFAAFWAAFFLAAFTHRDHPTTISLFGGGLVGATILLVGFHLLIMKLRFQTLLLLIILGGLLSFGYFTPQLLILLITPQGMLQVMNFVGNPILFSRWEYFFLLTVWQTGMALGMGWAISKTLVNLKDSKLAPKVSSPSAPETAV